MSSKDSNPGELAHLMLSFNDFVNLPVKGVTWLESRFPLNIRSYMHGAYINMYKRLHWATDLDLGELQISINIR